MRKTINLIFFVTCFCSTLSYAQQMTSEQYIEKYKMLAIESMIMYDIPASIKLAQALVETSSGNSRLAREANNHFGIKCKSYWQGEQISHDDDEQGECFRKYSSADDSYMDHSEFLTNSERYDALFTYEITDYEAWAKGLSAAGYATNPKYPLLLIKAIEDYELYLIDDEALEFKKEYLAKKEQEKQDSLKALKKPETPVAVTHTSPATTVKPITKESSEDIEKSSKELAKEAKKARKANKKNTKVSKASANSLTSVSLPSKIAQTTESTEQEGFMDKLKDKLNLSNGGVVLSNNIYDGPKLDPDGCVFVTSSPREVYKLNNVLFTIAKANDTFETIGNSLKISESRLLGYNEISGNNIRITEGSLVYLSMKGTKVRNGHTVYTVKKGDTLHKISQMYGIKMSSLAKINNFPTDYSVTIGQRINLK